MTRKDKLVDKFIKNPTSVSFFQLVMILESVGFKQLQAKGSHVKFKHAKLTNDLIIPMHNNDCHDFYKKLAKKYFEQVL